MASHSSSNSSTSQLALFQKSPIVVIHLNTPSHLSGSSLAVSVHGWICGSFRCPPCPCHYYDKDNCLVDSKFHAQRRITSYFAPLQKEAAGIYWKHQILDMQDYELQLRIHIRYALRIMLIPTGCAGDPWACFDYRGK